MAVWKFVDLNVPEAKILADLSGIENDLETTAQLCDLILNQLKTQGIKEHIFLEALTAAALVRYARSFTIGVRRKLPDSIIAILSEQELTDHMWFKDLRDKNIAHSVNAFEENHVVAHLVPEEVGPKGVSSISVQQSRLSLLSFENYKRLNTLSLKLKDQVTQRIKAEKEKVLQAARKLPVDELYERVDSPSTFSTQVDVSKPRKS